MFYPFGGRKSEAGPARPATPEAKSLLFPSSTVFEGGKEYPGVIEQVQQFARFNTQPTDLRGKSPQEIINFARNQGYIEVNLATAQPDELAAIQQAAATQPDLIATGNISEASLMQTIVTEFVYNPVAQNTFFQYVNTVVLQYPNLLQLEYNQFVLGTPATRDATDALNAHYLTNLGLPKKEEALTNPLRDRVLTIVNDAIAQIQTIDGRNPFLATISNADLAPNVLMFSSLEERNKIRGQQLMFGLLSNFLRGGVFYGFREGVHIEYPLRQIASDMIHSARAKQETATRQETLSTRRS